MMAKRHDYRRKEVIDNHIQVYHFEAPEKCYPRYNYTLQHTNRLLTRYKNDLYSLKLSDTFPIPVFDKVHIFIITEDLSDLLCCSQVCNVQSDRVIRKQLTLKDYLTSFEKEKSYGSTIFVANSKSSNFVLKLMGAHKIFISSETSSNVQASKSNIVSTSTINELPQNICGLLERAVLQTLFERVRVLQCLLQLKDSTVVFSETQLRLETESELAKTNAKKQKTDRSETDISGAPFLSRLWLKAWLNASKKLVIAQYKNSSIEFQDMLIKTLFNRKMSTKGFPSKEMYEGVLTLTGKEKETKENKDDVRGTIDEYETIYNLIIQVTQIQEAYKEHVLLVCIHKDDLQELHSEMQGLYYRSNVPPKDRPPATLDMNEDLDDMVSREILAVKGVTSFGNRCGILNIFVDKSLDNETKHMAEKNLQRILSKANISEYRFQYEQKSPKPFRDVGASVSTSVKGTLGGFVTLGGNNDLCILLARHVADFGSDVYHRESCNPNSMTPFARVLKPKTQSERYATYDIAIAKVVQEERGNCQILLKDDSGIRLPSRLYMFEDLNWLQGLQVHIWGASTKPGVGVIDIINLHMPDMLLLKVKDRPAEHGQAVKRFATEGDSGAVVCANDIDGKFVHAIAMIMGCSNPDDLVNDPKKRGEYVVFRLRNGLEQLKSEQQENVLDLC